MNKRNTMTRVEMIEKMVARVDEWDLETLISVAKAALTEDLKTLNDTDLENEYSEVFEEGEG